MDFVIELPQAAGLAEAFAQAPSLVTPVLQKALALAQAILAQNTTPETTPIRTGFLIRSFIATQQDLTLTWRPTAIYAKAVEFGLPASPGRYVPAIGKRLINEALPGFGMWPGFQGRAYMEKIVAASQAEIVELFSTAMQQVTRAIADAAL